MSTATLTFTLAGPMQAWGGNRPRTHGGGGHRPTQGHPTKSGVVGLLANALGRHRGDDITDLAGLVYACRVNRAGTPSRDFTTAGGGHFPWVPGDALADPALAKDAARTPDGATPTLPYQAPRDVTVDTRGRESAKTTGRTTVPSTAHYLADASFTVALTGPRDVVDAAAAALTRPARLLHLGRVAYPPTGDLGVAVTDHTDPVDALTGTPLPDRSGPGPWPIHSETVPGGHVSDQPTRFTTREFTTRAEGTTYQHPTTPAPAGAGDPTPTVGDGGFFTPGSTR